MEISALIFLVIWNKLISNYFQNCGFFILPNGNFTTQHILSNMVQSFFKLLTYKSNSSMQHYCMKNHKVENSKHRRVICAETNPGKILSWPERLAVLLGVAKAVHFLHTGVIPGFFNNKLKTHNILLNQHQLAKLSDYGLAIISEDNNHHEVKFVL